MHWRYWSLALSHRCLNRQALVPFWLNYIMNIWMREKYDFAVFEWWVRKSLVRRAPGTSVNIAHRLSSGLCKFHSWVFMQNPTSTDISFCCNSIGVQTTKILEHVMMTQLLYNLQNFMAVNWLESGWKQNEISNEFELWWQKLWVKWAQDSACRKRIDILIVCYTCNWGHSYLLCFLGNRLRMKFSFSTVT